MNHQRDLKSLLAGRGNAFILWQRPVVSPPSGVHYMRPNPLVAALEAPPPPPLARRTRARIVQTPDLSRPWLTPRRLGVDAAASLALPGRSIMPIVASA